MKTSKLFSLFVSIILCGITLNSFSQDVIILSNGNEIEAKIVKVGNSEIEYKKWSNQNGPTYTEQKNNIFMIKYQNGEKDIFNSMNNEQKTSAQSSNTNIETKPLIKPQNAIKKNNKIFFGINAGLGSGIMNEWGSDYYGYYDDYYLTLSGTLGLDLIFPIGNVFAIGPYLSAGLDSYDFATTFGAWAMFRFRNESGIMFGGGLNLLPGWDATGISVRLGGKFPNRIYLFGELTTSSYFYYSYYSGVSATDAVSFLIHLGVKLF